MRDTFVAVIQDTNGDKTVFILKQVHGVSDNENFVITENVDTKSHCPP